MTARQHHAPIDQLVPPQDLEAEMSMLGTMLWSGTALLPDGTESHHLDDVLAIIGRGESHYFYRQDHRKLFDAIVEMHGNDEPVDMVTLEAELRRRGDLEAIGGRDYLLDLVNSVPSVANGTHYARIVKAKGVLRQIIQAGVDMTHAAYEAEADADEIVRDAELAMMKVRGTLETGRVTRLSDAAEVVLKRLEAGEPEIGIPTPWGLLNNRLGGGIRGGELVYVGARQSVGKSSWGLGLASFVAAHHVPVILFSLEMKATSLATRLLSMQSGVDSLQFRNPAEDMNVIQLQNVLAQKVTQNLYVDVAPGLTTTELRSRSRQAIRKHGVGMIIVDYFQLMRPQKGAKPTSLYESLTKISGELKELAMEVNVPVVVMAQLNRAPANADRPPRPSDIRDTGAAEQDGDIVALLHCPKPDKEAEIQGIDFMLEKNREGPKVLIGMRFHAPTTTFLEAGVGD